MRSFTYVGITQIKLSVGNSISLSALWRSLERKPFVEPVCSPDFGRYIVYDVGGGRVEIFLGIQEGTGIGDLRRPRHNPVDDTFADHDGRFALAVGCYHSDRDGPVDHRMEKDGQL